MIQRASGWLVASLLGSIGIASLGLFSCQSDQFLWREAEVEVRIGPGPTLPISEQPIAVRDFVTKMVSGNSDLNPDLVLQMAPSVVREEPGGDVFSAIELVRQSLAVDYKLLDQVEIDGTEFFQWGWRVTLRPGAFGSGKYRVACSLRVLDRDGLQMFESRSLSITEAGETVQEVRSLPIAESRIRSSKGSASCELHY